MRSTVSATRTACPFLVPALIAVLASGCFTTRVITAPVVGEVVRIKYPRPESVTAVTRDHAFKTTPKVRSVLGRVMVVRPDSVAVNAAQLYSSARWTYPGTIMVANPASHPDGARWTERKYSAKRTALLILGPPVTIASLVTLGIIIFGDNQGAR
jgi:hypothetical protein